VLENRILYVFFLVNADEQWCDSIDPNPEPQPSECANYRREQCVAAWFCPTSTKNELSNAISPWHH
jgi:hypothetical protein